MAECSLSDGVHLSKGHDHYKWLPVEHAIARCRPKKVGDSIEAVAGELGVPETDLP